MSEQSPQYRANDTVEGQRLRAAESDGWRRWGPYLSDRQWGTVREDYSADGNAWDYLPHDHARSRAYRWGEDGIAGFGDETLTWCMALALWNRRDPILKERLFGLTNLEGNHGEDVKELYFHLDATPTHSYLRMLYKYPQAAFPYERLVEENARRGQDRPEFELLDTGVFEDDRYFDVTVEYAKAAADDVLLRITVVNRGPEAAGLDVLPMLWARNTWCWSGEQARPALRLDGGRVRAAAVGRPEMEYRFDGAADWLFCDNETNTPRLFGARASGPFKDGFNDRVVRGMADAVRGDGGTRCAPLVALELAAGGSAVLRLRLRPVADGAAFDDYDAIFAARMAEADAFYAALQSGIDDADARLVQRQALAGMIWSKQYYGLDVRLWLTGDTAEPAPAPARLHGRNSDWQHLVNADIVSMPDKWEYPWYASWDLCFHAVVFAAVDPVFAKAQVKFLLDERCLHPSGQVPAYEWNFGDANPPVQAWAAWQVYEADRAWGGGAGGGTDGGGDRDFLRTVFHKLLLNFGWWVNRKDAGGRNLFQGGFLGLDNIEIFDRDQAFPGGGTLDQADGSAWMAAYALTMMRIAIELSAADRVYEELAVKFFDHFLLIAEAMTRLGGQSGLWDEQDEFYYDVLRLPDGRSLPLRVRSLIGLIPMLAVHVIDQATLDALPLLAARLRWMLTHRPDLAALVSHWSDPGSGSTVLLSLLRGHRTKCLLARMLDPQEFLSPNGLRALSRRHLEPYRIELEGQSFSIQYLPGESDSRLFGGNSNWRGPVWLPINYLLVRALQEFHRYYGNEFQVECPVGSGAMLDLAQVAHEIARRLARLSLRGPDGQRPVMAAYPGLLSQAGAADLVLFHEYYHGDDGRGVGASHQTGWSGLVALLLGGTDPGG